MRECGQCAPAYPGAMFLAAGVVVAAAAAAAKMIAPRCSTKDAQGKKAMGGSVSAAAAAAAAAPLAREVAAAFRAAFPADAAVAIEFAGNCALVAGKARPAYLWMERPGAGPLPGDFGARLAAAHSALCRAEVAKARAPRWGLAFTRVSEAWLLVTRRGDAGAAARGLRRDAAARQRSGAPPGAAFGRLLGYLDPSDPSALRSSDTLVWLVHAAGQTRVLFAEKAGGASAASVAAREATFAAVLRKGLWGRPELLRFSASQKSDLRDALAKFGSY